MTPKNNFYYFNSSTFSISSLFSSVIVGVAVASSEPIVSMVIVNVSAGTAATSRVHRLVFRLVRIDDIDADHLSN